MNSPASNSDDILNGAARSLRNVRFAPIGTKSQALRRAHFWGKLSKAIMAVGAVLIGAGIIGGIIGWWGKGKAMGQSVTEVKTSSSVPETKEPVETNEPA